MLIIVTFIKKLGGSFVPGVVPLCLFVTWSAGLLIRRIKTKSPCSPLKLKGFLLQLFYSLLWLINQWLVFPIGVHLRSMVVS